MPESPTSFFLKEPRTPKRTKGQQGDLEQVRPAEAEEHGVLSEKGALEDVDLATWRFMGGLGFVQGFYGV